MHGVCGRKVFAMIAGNAGKKTTHEREVGGQTFKAFQQRVGLLCLARLRAERKAMAEDGVTQPVFQQVRIARKKWIEPVGAGAVIAVAERGQRGAGTVANAGGEGVHAL